MKRWLLLAGVLACVRAGCQSVEDFWREQKSNFSSNFEPEWLAQVNKNSTDLIVLLTEWQDDLVMVQFYPALPAERLASAQAEIKALQKLSENKIAIKLHGCAMSDKFTVTVKEDLSFPFSLTDESGASPPLSKKIGFLVKVAKAMLVVKEKKIVNGSLQKTSVAFTEEKKKHIRIVDFRNSGEVGEPLTPSNKTFWPPEFFNTKLKKRFSFEQDSWNFSLFCLEAFDDEFRVSYVREVIEKISNKGFGAAELTKIKDIVQRAQSKIPANCAKKFLSWLKLDAKERIGIEEMLKDLKNLQNDAKNAEKEAKQNLAEHPKKVLKNPLPVSRPRLPLPSSAVPTKPLKINHALPSGQNSKILKTLPIKKS